MGAVNHDLLGRNPTFLLNIRQDGVEHMTSHHQHVQRHHHHLGLIFFQHHGHSPEQTFLPFGLSGMNATRDDHGIVSHQLHSGCPNPHASVFTRWGGLMAHTPETPEPKP